MREIKSNDFQFGVDYMVHKINEAYGECAGDPVRFSVKILRIIAKEEKDEN